MARLDPGINDLATVRPDLAAQVVSGNPQSVTLGSDLRLLWRCEAGHEWVAAVHKRVSGHGCPFCSGKRVQPGVTDLATTHPHLATQLVDTDPSQLLPGSHTKALWRCSAGHEWRAAVRERTRRGRGCPFCAGQRAIPGVTDLATINSKLASELVEADPSALTTFSGQKVAWRCAAGHEWLATVANRSNGSGCPYCSGRVPIVGETDLATTSPHLAAELVGTDPTLLTRASSKRVTWRCPLGHEFKATVASRKRGTGCPYCSNNRVLVGFNDLATTHPDLVDELVDNIGHEVTRGSTRKVQWRCAEGHTWRAMVANRSKGVGCPYCAGNEILVGFNDLATTHPELASELVAADPTHLSRGSVRKVKWRCARGHEWIASPNSRTSQDSGCATCNPSGFAPAAPAWLYLLARPNERNVGITGDIPSRLATHSRAGSWDQVLDVVGPIRGTEALEWETQIKRYLRRHVGTLPGRTEQWATAHGADITSLRELSQLAGVVMPEPESVNAAARPRSRKNAPTGSSSDS